jgi:type I restriction enzyme, S subunit
MSVQSVAFPKAFAVWFRDIDRWDVSSFQRITWHWPKQMMVPIGALLRPRKERVDRSVHNFTDLQPLTIHFDGSVRKRVVNADREYSMDLWFARPGDIVVAKIDLKNGAVGIVPPDWKNVVVTGHFAVYEPDRARLLPEYLHRIIQADFFKAHLWRNKVGAEGRKEVKLDFFEQELIPLPDLSIQRGIVSRWQSARERITLATKRVEKRKAESESRFFTDMGLKVPTSLSMPKAFAVTWVDFLRWGVGFNFFNQTAADLSIGKNPVVELGSIVDLIQYGTSEKANTTSDGVAVIRMNNIVEGQLDLSKLKHLDLSNADIQNLLLSDGDILFNRTNSKELVGKCAVFHAQGAYVFASYLIRVRVNRTVADPDFVAYVINSPIGRQQINALSRQIIGQANVNSEELRSLRIPLPPLAEQKQIMQRVTDGRSEIAREREATQTLATSIRAEVEALILGTKSLKGT